MKTEIYFKALSKLKELIRIYANPGRWSQQRRSSATNAKVASLTGSVGSEDHSYLGVGANTAEGGGKKGRRSGQKSRQMLDDKGLYMLSILCNDFNFALLSVAGQGEPGVVGIKKMKNRYEVFVYLVGICDQ